MLEAIKCFLATAGAKCVYRVCRILKKRGSTGPGRIALKICPDYNAVMAKKIKKGIIVTCGTNGKTTTNNLINSAVRAAGYTTVCNREGANMVNGIAAAFAKSASFFGGLKADFACLEIDEANMPLALKSFKPDIIVVTNLFRDQLDRYGEIDITAKLLQRAFDMAKDAKLVLNADDPVTQFFGNGRDAVYYGIDGKTDACSVDEIRDGSSCPACGEALSYEYYHYGQIGKYKCEKCGYTNRKYDFSASNIKIADGVLSFDAVRDGGSVHIDTHITGLYNVYNTLMAYAALNLSGISDFVCASVFGRQKPEPGRMSRFNIGGKCVYLILSKNPTGFNQSVTTVLNDSRQKDIMLVLNDNAQDGEDISWIWDVDFEAMRHSAEFYTITGKRRFDMYLRLKYADYDTANITVEDTISQAIDKMLQSDKNLYYVLVNYTAMYPCYLELKRRAEDEN